MELYLKTLLFAFLKISIVQGENLCQSSSCGSSKLSVQFPFKLETQTPTNNCTYFDLTCNITQSQTIVNLPHAGDFYVENIDYFEGYIQLYDPGNCLMKRIMNSSLEYSPFKAKYNNYTFYACSLDSEVLEYVKPIDCLNNSTSKTIATCEYSGDLDRYGCSRIGSWLLPLEDYGVYNYDDASLFLTWDASVCKACQEFDDHGSGEEGSKSSKPISKIVAIAISMPALIIMALSCCSVFCLHLLKMIGEKHEADSVAAAAAAPTTMATAQTTTAVALPQPSTTSNAGLDESKIIACTELVVVSERDGGIPSVNSTMCSICLENYHRKETISLISKCGHQFHAKCIQQWLGKNGTCPVCRTSL